MARVICLIYAGSVDECLVVDDKDEQEIINKLADANDKKPEDEKVWIHSLAPTDLQRALEYISEFEGA